MKSMLVSTGSLITETPSIPANLRARERALALSTAMHPVICSRATMPAAAETVAYVHRLGDPFGGAGEDRTDGGTQSLVQADCHGVRMAGQVGHLDTQEGGGVE